MSEKPNTVDLGEAPLDAGVTTTPAKTESTVSIDAKPLGVMNAMGVPPETTEDANAALAQALGGEEQKTEEEKPTASQIDAAVQETIDDPDLYINQFTTGPRTLVYLDKKLHELYPTDEEQKAAKEDPMSLFNLLLNAFRNGWGTNQAVSVLEVLGQKTKDDKKVYEKLIAKNDKSLGNLGDNTTHKLHRDSVDLQDDEARDAFMAKISGLKKIKLLNSGFWVTVRRPLIFELQDIFDAADLEMREVGYSIGAHFALMADLYIKKRFVESVIKYRIIRDSNLEGIFKGDTFINALSLQDYDALIQGVLSLMCRKGLRARVICPECQKATLLEKIDIDSAVYINQDLITPEMTAWWDAKVDENGKPIGKRTLKDLKKYRDEILKLESSFTTEVDDTKIKFYLRVPTMAEYLDAGDKLISRIRETIDERSVDDENRRQIILANLAAHTLHMISPWISKIENIEEDGSVSMRTSGFSTILSAFDTLTQDDNPIVFEEFTKFLAASRITYIGTYALECPYCHKKPDLGADQFYPLEVQTIFFGQLYRLFPVELTQAGK